VEHSRTLGISRIDLGKGPQDYKRRFGNTSAMVAAGSVDLLSLSNLPRIVHRSCSNFVRHTPALLHIARQTKRIFCK
jgi:CelD/BcsL family acetyltransferase involved in cellulose biosynthesis